MGSKHEEDGDQDSLVGGKRISLSRGSTLESQVTEDLTVCDEFICWKDGEREGKGVEKE